MIKLGIVSYNIYCNFTNYGSALQSWALSRIINKVGEGEYSAVLVDYCPDVLLDKNPLDPFKNMWDKDEESRRNCELTMPSIRENYYKFDTFYNTRFDKTKEKYVSKNFNDIKSIDKIEKFICGSDTIFCIDEFDGFDDGYFANFAVMKNNSISYAASFGDAHFDEKTYKILNERLTNFKALGIRENKMIDYIKHNTKIPVSRTIDPTLLLTKEDYDSIASDRIVDEKYLLLYTRRYNKEMEDYAEYIAKKYGLKVVEISLRAVNREKGHIMKYDAGVEEFLSLVKYADYVVTNSFHGLIFAVQYEREFSVFSRQSGDSKINEVLDLFGLNNRLLIGFEQTDFAQIDYQLVQNRIDKARKNSISFLKKGIAMLGE